MNQLSIQAFSGEINNQTTTLVNGEELHAYLGIQTPYSKWILRRIDEFGFVRDLDFIGVDKFVRTEAGFFGARDKAVIQYHLTLDMAKELCMVERSEIGRQARRYFIEIEKEHREAMPQWAMAQLSQAQAQRSAAQVLALSGNAILREVLRLVWLGLSISEIAKLLDCSATTVSKYRSNLKAMGLLMGAPVLTNGAKRLCGLPRGDAPSPTTPLPKGGEPIGSSREPQASLPLSNAHA